MKNARHLPASRFHVNRIPGLLFLISVILSIITTYYVSTHYIDSDTSSELILAQHWIETKNILSPDWLYGSELRLFHVQLIYAPLMLLMDDWQMVRFVGALIMQGLYITSFACLVRAAGKSKNFFFCGGAMLLLPVSVAYGRIVLYHNHYLPNITLAFSILALTMHFIGAVNWRSGKTWLRLMMLAMLSFIGGMNSIRQLLITHAPLLLCAVAFCWIEDLKQEEPGKTAFLNPGNLNFLLSAIYSAAFSLLGLKAQGLLRESLGIQIGIQSENNTLNLMEADRINDMLYGFFHQFGFRHYVPMISVNGVLALGGIFTGCYLLIVSLKRLLQNKVPQNKRFSLLSLFLTAHVAVLVLVFLLTSGLETPYYYPLYFSLCYPWAVPLILIHLEELPAATHPLHAKKLFASVALVFLLLSGMFNILYFQGSESFPQLYEGLSFKDRDKKAGLTEVVTFLTEQGYDKGYAVHWESNIVTEMTNGDIPMVIIDRYANDSGSSANLSYAEYLYSLWLKESPCEKPFLLLTEETSRIFPHSDSSAFCTQIYSGNGHVAYHIDNPEEFIATLQY